MAIEMNAPGAVPSPKPKPAPRPRLHYVHVYPVAAGFAWMLGIGLFLYFFSPLKLIVLGFLAAAAVAAMLMPLTNRLRGPRPLRAIIVGLSFIVTALGVLTLVSWLLVDPVSKQVERLPQMKESLNRVLGGIGRMLGVRGLDVDSVVSHVGQFFTGDKLDDMLSRTADISTAVVLVVLFVFAGSIYLLAEPRGRMLNSLMRLLPERRRGALRGIVDDLTPRLRWWLLGTLVGMLMIGVASYLGFLIVGLEFALPLALLMALSEAIPTVGPAAAFTVAAIFGAAQGLDKALGVGVVYAVVQGLESYVVLPLIMRRAVDIPPVVTLFTVVLWGKVFGVAGLLLAVPIDLVIWSVLEHFLVRPSEPQVLVSPEVSEQIKNGRDQGGSRSQAA